MTRRTFLRVPWAVWLAFAGTSLAFFLFPQIDLGFSRLFYTPGLGFTINGVWYEQLIYYTSEALVVLVALALILAWIYGRLSKHPRLPVRLSGRKLAFVLLVLALGPGLIINLGLKEHWGRARPVKLVQFGGAERFSPAWVISDQGGHSFCSGHAGATFWLITAAMVVPSRRRKLWLALAGTWGVVVGVTRIASGGHFLSDILVAFFIVLILTLMLRDLMLRGPPEAAASETRGYTQPPESSPSSKKPPSPPKSASLAKPSSGS